MTTMNERDLYYGQRLAEMIRCKTVSHKEGFEPEEFLKLRRVIGTLFPLVTEKAERTILGEDAYLYKLPGKDPSRNVLLMVAPRRRGSDRQLAGSALCRRHPRRKALGTRHGRHQDAAVCGVFRARGAAARGLRIPGERSTCSPPTTRSTAATVRCSRTIISSSTASALTGSATRAARSLPRRCRASTKSAP